MKKWLALILALALMLSVSACGESSNNVSTPEAVSTESNNDVSETKTEDPAEDTIEETSEVHEHTFGEWEVETAPTCIEDGEEIRICSDCGETETQVISATGHNFTPATCFFPKTCAECGETEGEPLAITIKNGETVSTEEHSFYIADTYFATKLSEKNGNITYSYGNDGHYLIIKLNFTNLSTEVLECFHSSRGSDISLTYGNKYSYEGDLIVLTDDIVPLGTGNAYLMFAIPETMESDNQKSIYATFTIDGTQYAYIVSWGDGSDWSTDEDKTDESAETNNGAEQSNSDENIENSSGALFLGDTKSGDDYEFTLSNAFFTSELSEKNGSTTYSYGDQGYLLVFKLAYTNLLTESVEEFKPSIITDISLTYNNKYTYEGEARVLVDEIVPLATGNLYIIYTVAETLQGASEPLIATFTVCGNTYTVDCRALGL